MLIPSRLAKPIARSSYPVPRGSHRLGDFMVHRRTAEKVVRGAIVSAVIETQRMAIRPRAEITLAHQSAVSALFGNRSVP